jgi:hypothetical protein
LEGAGVCAGEGGGFVMGEGKGEGRGECGGERIGGRIWSRVDRLGVLSSVDSIVCCALFFLIRICFAVGTDGAGANIGGIM